MPKFKGELKNHRFNFYDIPEELKNLIMAPNDNIQNSAGTSSANNLNNNTNNTNNSFTISLNDLMKDAQRIHEYRGDSTYSLSSFIREVDTVLPLFNSNQQAKAYIFERIIINKIQGAALDVIRSIGVNATWEEMKAALTNAFGVKETYHQLLQEAFSLRNISVSEYFTKLLNILAKLNEKYEYDSEKPYEFSPKVIESVILRTFLNNIDISLASIIINKEIKGLREAYNLLENLGLIRENKNYNKNNMHSFNKNSNPNRPKQNNSFQNNFKSNSYNNSPNFNSRANFNQNNQNYNNNFKHNNNYQPKPGTSGQTRQNHNGYRNFYNSNRNNDNNRQEPMDVDHIQHEANFLSEPPKHNYR